MKHKHHIIPRHAGGSNDSSNIVELTVEEHAEAHKKLWEQHGKEEDRCAWRMLLGHTDALVDLRRIKALEWYRTHKKGPRTLESRIKQGISNKGHKYHGGSRPKGYKLSEESKRQIGLKNKGRKIPKIGEQNRKRVWSEASRKKLSDSLKAFQLKKRTSKL